MVGHNWMHPQSQALFDGPAWVRLDDAKSSPGVWRLHSNYHYFHHSHYHYPKAIHGHLAWLELGVTKECILICL